MNDTYIENVYINYIKKHAEFVGHQIVGNLKRKPELETKHCRCYADEADNHYHSLGLSICIYTADGRMI